MDCGAFAHGHAVLCELIVIPAAKGNMTISRTDPFTMANANTMQFSSMPQRRGIALFPFRGYEPNFQRWLNQDPVREAGGINFYGYVNNRPLGYVDPFGLSVYSDLGDAELAAYSSAANFFTGSQNASTADPNSYLALTGQAGLITPLSDADGNSASTALGNAAADSLGMAAAIGGMMLPGGAEDEAAAALAAKLGKELSDCEKAAKAAADAAKALPNVAKAVNSNLAHAAEQAAERKVFNSTSDAADALRSLSESITKNGFPAGTLQDTAYADRVLVPVGNNGMAVYQVGANGTAKLKTVLIAH